ncbi:STAS domain-containing protein [Thalassotalea marina]|uniref:STAS domain-containing protein n=1 Tax=Thalassotalea marina TaxID=1673741 RepID=A0A919EKV8_9GAMM|nr:STAS domain-containing protein [Thalassotalea marina]GHF93383.1 hypothetical protein GCM10017161_22150 [Thalassotalea marina]
MFKLPSELTIVQVDECKTNFLAYVETNDELAFDDSELTRIDTVGMQLILSMVIHIASLKKQLNWQVSSSIIGQSISQLGINEPILNQYLP